VGKIQATQLQQGSRLNQIEDRLTAVAGTVNDQNTKSDEALALLHELAAGSTAKA
jgi:uncharacterized membrane-anchored protein